MPYLPPNIIDGADFPEPFGKDLVMQIRLIKEMYERQFPPLAYFPLKVAVTPELEADASIPVGEAGTSQFDPLWGDPVPTTLEGAKWEQPHLDTGAVHDATETLQWDGPKLLNMRIQREAKETDLKRWGFDQVRDILAFVPLVLLDEQGVTVHQGDKFRWDGDEYTVLQFDRDGYWKNTNIRLFIVLNCEHTRHGS